jgi:ketosteroid isomerase-like protein
MADPVSVLKDYDAAWNAHDVEGVMAFFTDDAVVRLEPAPPDEFGGVYRGKEQIRLAMSSRLWQASTSTPGTIK